MSGVSFLYAMWHSHVVREHIAVDVVEDTIHAAAAVFTGLMRNCPPARTCREALLRINEVVLKKRTTASQESSPTYANSTQTSTNPQANTPIHAPDLDERRRNLRFDTDFRDLFTDVTGRASPHGQSQAPLGDPHVRTAHQENYNTNAGVDFEPGSFSRAGQPMPLSSLPGANFSELWPSFDPNSGSMDLDTSPPNFFDTSTPDFFNFGSGYRAEWGPLPSGSSDDVFMGSDLPPSGEPGAGIGLLDQFWFGNTTGLSEQH